MYERELNLFNTIADYVMLKNYIAGVEENNGVIGL